MSDIIFAFILMILKCSEPKMIQTRYVCVCAVCDGMRSLSPGAWDTILWQCDKYSWCFPHKYCIQNICRLQRELQRMCLCNCACMHLHVTQINGQNAIHNDSLEYMHFFFSVVNNNKRNMRRKILLFIRKFLVQPK